MQKGGINPILILLIVMVLFLSVFLVGGTSRQGIPVNTNPTPTAQVVDIASRPTNAAGNSLQIGDVPFVTLTPIPTPTPTNEPTPPPAKGSIDFSSASLDWDDVLIIMTQIPGIASIDGNCMSELQHTVDVEEGYPPVGAAPKVGTRVALCRGNASCKAKGYGAYDGSTTLPTFVPSDACQTQISNAFNKIQDTVNTNPAYMLARDAMDTIANELKPPIFPNCDKTDHICFP